MKVRLIMEVKAINIVQKEFNELDDFFFSCEAFIGPETEEFVYEVYDFNVISIEKLHNEFMDTGIMLNRGWMIMKYYDETEVKRKINSIIKKCIGSSDDETYMKLNAYFRQQES